jgi:hypothetical protein
MRYCHVIRIVVSTDATCIILPVHLGLIEELDAFHDIVHFESIKFQKTY